jgi:hypothetical protein
MPGEICTAGSGISLVLQLFLKFSLSLTHGLENITGRPAINAHGSLDLKQEIQIQIQMLLDTKVCFIVNVSAIYFPCAALELPADNAEKPSHSLHSVV